MDFIYKHYIRVEWFYALILHLEYNSTQNLFTHEKKKTSVAKDSLILCTVFGQGLPCLVIFY